MRSGTGLCRRVSRCSTSNRSSSTGTDDPLAVMHVAQPRSQQTRVLGVVDESASWSACSRSCGSPSPSSRAWSPETLLATSPMPTVPLGSATRSNARAVSDVMLRASDRCVRTDTIDEAFRPMHARHLSGLYVVDDGGRPTGYLDLHRAGAALRRGDRGRSPETPADRGRRDRRPDLRRDLRADRDGARRQDRRRAARRITGGRARDHRSGRGVRGDRPQRHLPADRDDESWPAILRRTGFFQWVAIQSVKVAGGEPVPAAARAERRLARVLSAFLDNVTTVVLHRAGHALHRDGPARLAGAVPDQRDPGVEHRRGGDADRRPAEHPDRLGGGSRFRRLPHQHGVRRRSLIFVVFLLMTAVLFLRGRRPSTTMSARRSSRSTRTRS